MLIEGIEFIASLEVCRNVSQEEIQKKRKAFKKRFIRYKILNGRKRHAYSDFVLHHIVPLGLGGGNDCENIAYVERVLERAIHGFINGQAKPKRDEARIMIIPRRLDKIWMNELT